ncbi:Organic hydroperoxide resistance transcriptional regulator [Microbulbifer sp. THAF38]|nr:Organic hydroperoxide resistance transcriptional regulator [Microbulbifer sp. THAF38]
MTLKEFNLQELVCFALYSTANSMVREYRPELDQFDLTYPQFLVMMSLWNEDSVFIKELSHQTYLDAGTLTQVLKRLEAKEFIERQKSSVDERAKVIVLTQKGRNLKQKTSHILEDMACKVRLTAEEQQDLTSLCHKILSRLKK